MQTPKKPFVLHFAILTNCILGNINKNQQDKRDFWQRASCCDLQHEKRKAGQYEGDMLPNYYWRSIIT
jgi:hypothetical protein